jgi:ATP-binding cassette subfamily C (CFTR/MRP) protein 4
MDPESKVQQQKNPREKASFFSIVFFWWMNPLLTLGYRQDLQLEDLYEPRKEDESEVLGDSLEAEWRKEQEGTKEKPPSLTRALIRCFGRRYALLGIFTAFEECILRIYQPLFMGWMIDYFSPESRTTKLEAYLYAAGVVLCAAIYTFTHHPYFFGVMHLGMKLRVAACSLLYRKALKLSNSALGQTTVGQMVNLLSNDVNRLGEMCLLQAPRTDAQV